MQGLALRGTPATAPKRSGVSGSNTTDSSTLRRRKRVTHNVKSSNNKKSNSKAAHLQQQVQLLELEAELLRAQTTRAAQISAPGGVGSVDDMLSSIRAAFAAREDELREEVRTLKRELDKHKQVCDRPKIYSAEVLLYMDDL